MQKLVVVLNKIYFFFFDFPLQISARNTSSAMSKSYTANTTTNSSTSTAAGTTSVRSQRDKTESYKSFYETNL